jgi:hypothetical protein
MKPFPHSRIKRKHIEVDMDDAILVRATAAQYIKDMGSGAIGHLREMQELAVSLCDADSAQAWHDIEDAAHGLLLVATSDSSRPAPQSALPMPVSLG